MFKYFVLIGVTVFFLNAFNYSTPPEDPHGGSVVYHEFRDSALRDTLFNYEPVEDGSPAFKKVITGVDSSRVIRIHTFHTKGSFGQKQPLDFLTAYQWIQYE